MSDEKRLEEQRKALEERKRQRAEAKPPAEETDEDTYDALNKAAEKPGIMGRVNQRFQDALQSSRGSNRGGPRGEAGESPHISVDDLAIRRAPTVSLKRMTVPEGVIIDGSMTSGSETEIAGRIDGNVTVDGILMLRSSALVSGNVRATVCQVEGHVEGKLECSQDLSLGVDGRLNADCQAGKRVVIAGQVFGDVSCSGLLHLEASAQVTGNIRARKIVIEEGATFNGECAMRAPAQRSEK